MLAALPLITSILTAVAADIPIIQELIKLLEGIFSEKREPTEAEWAQLVALAERAHADLQGAQSKT